METTLTIKELLTILKALTLLLSTNVNDHLDPNLEDEIRDVMRKVEEYFTSVEQEEEEDEEELEVEDDCEEDDLVEDEEESEEDDVEDGGCSGCCGGCCVNQEEHSFADFITSHTELIELPVLTAYDDEETKVKVSFVTEEDKLWLVVSDIRFESPVRSVYRTSNELTVKFEDDDEVLLGVKTFSKAWIKTLSPVSTWIDVVTDEEYDSNV
jgi:hypothetical protein